jgi:dipeptidyl aminopeptidase/acylaminoacyl peptidase
VLATADATKEVGRAEAGAPIEGEVQTRFDEQRIAVVENARLRFVSPPDLYVYEYAERPDGSFVGTAAHGDGDSNWWVAGLYGFGADGSARLLFQPGPREQLASPVVSPDGRAVAFVGGWMSDFGSTGGDAWRLDLAPGATPVNLTPGLPATVTGLDWDCGASLVASELAGPDSVLTTLDASPRVLRRDPMMLTALSCRAGHAAAITQDFTHPPELLAGPVDGLRAITHVNDAALAAPGQARSLSWRVDGHAVQGWLFTPPGAGQAKRPLIVDVHGGPEAAARPRFATQGSEIRAFLAQGWDVIEPNYRGSFGAGEAFASASIGDLGGGDWRDTLASIDAARAATPIDETRLAITGGSYGGYMAMWAVSQTHRFRAAMADAGVSDWLSIEGEAPQAGSDQVNFGGSVYDNAEPYLRASPIMHIKGATTPTLIIVGDRDLECPMPQSLEFHTALVALGVPDSFVVYRDEGHAFSREADRRDRRARTIAWFRKWFAADARKMRGR